MRRLTILFRSLIAGLSLCVCASTLTLWLRSQAFNEDVTYIDVAHGEDDVTFRFWALGFVGDGVIIAGHCHLAMSTLELNFYDSIMVGGAANPLAAGWHHDRGAKGSLDILDQPPAKPAVHIGRFRVGSAKNWFPTATGKTSTAYWITVPAWLIAFASSVAPAAEAIAWQRRRARRRQGRCRRCGYDLRATPGRCPECGAAVLPAMA
jgi:hypothetical protein